MGRQLFEVIDDIIRIGKVIYDKIPIGSRCKDCPLMVEIISGKKGYCCELRNHMQLFFDKEGPFKSDSCPVPKE